MDVAALLAEIKPGERRRLSLAAGTSADGAALSLAVNVIAGAYRGPRLVMVAGVHGDEYEGITALAELFEQIDPGVISGTLIMVPVANPPAFRAGARRGPDDLLDMNRVFPGRPEGTLTERLAHLLYSQVITGADFVLSMHGWTKGAMVVPYTEYPAAGPLSARCKQAATAFGLDYIEAFDWHPGLLVANCIKDGIPAIEPEVGGAAVTLPERRARCKQGALNLMAHLGMLDATLVLPAAVKEVTRQALYAPAGGLVLRRRELGEPVKVGDVVAVVCDLGGQPIAEVRAPVDGFIAAVMQAAAANPGDLLAVIFSLH